MTLEIKTDPAIYTYACYWLAMIFFSLSPFLWERQMPQVLALSISLGVVTLLLAHRIKQHFKNICSLLISLSPIEFAGGLSVIFGAIAAGFYVAA